MPQTMQALVKPAPQPGIEVREVPLPVFGPSDVLVKVEAASVCGTDPSSPDPRA
jgi:threonine 3-dehydrogenase